MFQIIFGALLTAAPLATSPETANTTLEQNQSTITAEELMAWYDQEIPMTVLDARGEKYFDGRLLPHATWLTSSTSEEEILSTLPDKEALIVVYCYSSGCPASGWLYDKLIALGYKNVYEYHEGLVDWVKKGYPLAEKE